MYVGEFSIATFQEKFLVIKYNKINSNWVRRGVFFCLFEQELAGEGYIARDELLKISFSAKNLGQRIGNVHWNSENCRFLYYSTTPMSYTITSIRAATHI